MPYASLLISLANSLSNKKSKLDKDDCILLVVCLIYKIVGYNSYVGNVFGAEEWNSAYPTTDFHLDVWHLAIEGHTLFVVDRNINFLLQDRKYGKRLLLYKWQPVTLRYESSIILRHQSHKSIVAALYCQNLIENVTVVNLELWTCPQNMDNFTVKYASTN